MSCEPAERRSCIRVTEAVVRRHQGMVWRYCRFLGCPPTEADDLAQDTFLAALRNPPEDRGDVAFGRWLRATAFNLFKNRRRRPRVLVPLDEAAFEVAWCEHAGVDDGETYVRALRACIAELPGAQRRAVEIRYGDGGSRAEVASALSLRDAGVKSLLRRARFRLRSCLQRALHREVRR